MLEHDVKFQLIDCDKCHQRSLVPIILDQRPRSMSRRDRRYFAKVAKQFQAELMEGSTGACPKCGAPGKDVGSFKTGSVDEIKHDALQALRPVLTASSSDLE